ncbi:MAG: SHOCT domain-containing protein [Xylophilus sp.]|nr:SHOCT domain-containing protein [Xylophilus sp.]
MHFLFGLLGLFVIGSLLHGLYVGLRSVARGLSWFQSQPATEDATPEAMGATEIERGIDELTTLFALYQSGALTQQEYDALKQALLCNVVREHQRRR